MKYNIPTKELNPIPKKGLYSSDHTVSGIPIPKPKRIELFSPEEWEEFTEEWATSLSSEYKKILRVAGSGDTGLDVVGFINGETFEDGFDNYQCKHYDSPLTPSDIWVEISKVIYYSFIGDYPVPRKYYFVAAKGIGTKLGKLLAKPLELKAECKSNWEKSCETQITAKRTIPLSDDLLKYFNHFDFSIFSSKSSVELISGHSQTQFHTVRFGGGVPLRPEPDKPPKLISKIESRYIEQIYQAYSEYTGKNINHTQSFEKHEELKKDFLRQRERFYHAESLRNFARDTVPTGTYEELQEDIFDGIIDLCESEHKNGFERMKATITMASQIHISSSPLSSVTRTKDKQGICHQLANEDRIFWVLNRKENVEPI